MSLISREWCPKKKRFKKNHSHRKKQKTDTPKALLLFKKIFRPQARG